ncbi:SUMF1/EgtB/PvdO family nonheme iron enzyme [Paracoccus sp. IB05]|uniref:SUMF1/EgtB/PvdO family nonheme iron enzyme n=1 Tax=Paracoccus sp. IB05 TaxID=2779367 RepID=UPI0018E8B955|nr:SUMF1/EgtB/PvdO family nonheme iron enzyme [Paracoccus sp. IB05]MBJ2153137.1 SUMF1/EgtB/PvdO family nonheme iron enzyme [Paracoccus sp. IB05]
MQIGTLFLSGVVTALAGLLPLALPETASEPPPEGPQVVRLDPQPFEHRIDGDWQRGGLPADAPLVVVSIPAPVDIMAVPVSHGDWMDCVNAGACTPPGHIAAQPDLPVTAVSWHDAQSYAAWLSARGGETWRLPTDVEWAHAAAELFRDDALGVESDPANPAVRWLAEYQVESARSRNLDREIRPVGRLNVNSLGVHDIGGAVWEWTSTCLRRGEIDAQGRILRETESCGIYIAEGLHRAAMIDFVRDPKSGGCSVGVPPANLGFRLVREVS